LLKRKVRDDEIFLALPQEAYQSLQEIPALIEFIADQQIGLLIFDAEREEILQWIR